MPAMIDRFELARDKGGRVAKGGELPATRSDVAQSNIYEREQAKPG